MPREVDRRLELSLAVTASALCQDERDRAECPVSGDERYAERRLQAELLEDVVQLGLVDGRFAKQLVGDLAEELRLSRSDDIGDAVGSVRLGRILLRQLVRPAHLVRLGVGERQPLERAVA